MNPAVKKAFDAAQDAIKQLLTLSTAIVGAVVTFSGSGSTGILDFKAAGWPIPFSIVWMLLSMMFGFFALLNIIGSLSTDAAPTPYKGVIRFFAGGQILFFFAAIVTLGVFAPHWNWEALRFW